MNFGNGCSYHRIFIIIKMIIFRDIANDYSRFSEFLTGFETLILQYPLSFTSCRKVSILNIRRNDFLALLVD